MSCPTTGTACPVVAEGIYTIDALPCVSYAYINANNAYNKIVAGSTQCQDLTGSPGCRICDGKFYPTFSVGLSLSSSTTLKYNIAESGGTTSFYFAGVLSGYYCPQYALVQLTLDGQSTTVKIPITCSIATVGPWTNGSASGSLSI